MGKNQFTYLRVLGNIFLENRESKEEICGQSQSFKCVCYTFAFHSVFNSCNPK